MPRLTLLLAALIAVSAFASPTSAAPAVSLQPWPIAARPDGLRLPRDEAAWPGNRFPALR